MLVLTRKIGEQLRIGNIVLQIRHIRGGKVRLGIEAPLSVPIRRAELPPQKYALKNEPVAQRR
jgi:carbon storage regulator CsrA